MMSIPVHWLVGSVGYKIEPLPGASKYPKGKRTRVQRLWGKTMFLAPFLKVRIFGECS